MTEDDVSHELFERAQAKELDAEATELAKEEPTSDYNLSGATPDLKTSIIEVTRSQDDRIREMLVKELVLSNITKNEVRIVTLYANAITSFFFHEQPELGREWLGKMQVWLLANRSVNFEQQKILVTQMKGLIATTNASKEKKELI